MINAENFTPTDHYYMTLALALAQQGAEKGEVPVGAVLVQFEHYPHPSPPPKGEGTVLPVGGGGEKIGGGLDNPEGKILAEGYNQPILSHDPTAHAEIVALRCACDSLQNYRLPPNTCLYVTLEPCTMCVGALIHARLSRLVFATHEPRAGMVGSQGNLLEQDFYNHKKILVQSGLLAEQSSTMLKAFFKERRERQKQLKKAKNL